MATRKKRTVGEPVPAQAPGPPPAETTRDRIHSLELENARLRRVVASQALTIEALREVSRGTY